MSNRDAVYVTIVLPCEFTLVQGPSELHYHTNLPLAVIVQNDDRLAFIDTLRKLASKLESTVVC